jgi:hypothetical protein
MTTTSPVILVDDLSRAMRHFNANKAGLGLRTGSARYAALIAQITESADPLATAKALIASLRRASPSANKRRRHSGKPAEVKHLQAVVAEMLAGFPEGLDPRHWAMLRRAKAAVLTGGVTLADLGKLAAELREVKAYDPRQHKWRRFQPVAPELLRGLYKPAGIKPV